MRTFHKQKLNNLLVTIAEAQEKELYSLCQDAAFKMMDFICEYESEDAPAVGILEEYVKFLFLAHNKEIDLKHLKKQFTKVERVIKFGLESGKLEVVFFPYKASMWDSMESVWLAAKNDPRCDAKVVPIPYYDRLPGGKLGKMYYEGNEYPDYVPIVDWKEYDVEKANPDVAFAHNPYGSNNSVTFIPEAYHIKNLKKNAFFTVYLPYVVHLDEPEPMHASTEGFLLSDMVFLQSEQTKQKYLANLSKLNNISLELRNAMGDKLLVFGSPKADKVINGDMFNYHIPEKWQQKANGKRVVFFNSSIGDMLQNTTPKSNSYLFEHKKLFSYFNSNQTTLLLWRPHPLLESSFRSMRPHLLNDYLKIRDTFIKDDIGIYDDTVDLHRAVYFSDACYGVSSSISALFAISGKPVLVKDYNLTSGTSFSNEIDPTKIILDESSGDSNFSMFIDSIEMLIEHNEKRKNLFFDLCLTSSDGTASKKIMEYIINRLLSN